jgi:DNA-binding GntR family transcriptional regulator
MILSGRFNSDDVLSERSLATLLDVSRVPVREAIKELEREGMLIVVPRSGVLVRRLTMDEVRELYEVRQAMEGMAAFLCASHPQDGTMKAMRQKLEALAGADAVDHPAIQKASSAFHRMLFDLSRNSQLRAVYNTVEPKIDLNLRLTAVHGLDRIEQALAEHIDIAKAIEARDPEQAEKLTRQHLENGKAARLGILAELKTTPSPTKKPRGASGGLRGSSAPPRKPSRTQHA